LKANIKQDLFRGDFHGRDPVLYESKNQYSFLLWMYYFISRAPEQIKNG